MNTLGKMNPKIICKIYAQGIIFIFTQKVKMKPVLVD
jgi:hypothetical protein